MLILKANRRICAALFCCATAAVSANASTITDLGNLGGGSSQGAAINNSGVVTGTSTGGAFNIPFEWQQGTGMVSLGSLGGSGGAATAINDAGQIVGNSFTPGFTFHAFLKTPGSPMTDLGTLGGSGSVASGINDLGQVTGYSYLPGGAQNAFLYTPGQGMVSLGTLGGVAASTFDVNNLGQVVGYSIRSVGPMAVLYTPGAGSVDLGVLGQGTTSIAFAMNDAGQAVGYSTVDAAGATNHAFVYAPGAGLTDLGTLSGSTSSFATDINELGQIVGYTSGGGLSRAFIYSGGSMIDLNTLLPANSGWQLLTATGINDHGQITGSGFNPQGQKNAYLLDISSLDAPEPATMWLAAGAIGLAGLFRKRGITK